MPEAPLEARVRELREACRRHGHLVTADDRVRENVAAELVGRAAGTLRNWALAGGPLLPVRVAGRRLYRLVDIAKLSE